jgi:hypothetical protein
MGEDYRIYVDGEQSATLNDGGGALTDYRTLQEAVLAWRGLRPEQKVRATVKVIGGPVYSAYEIDRLYYVPKPALSTARIGGRLRTVEPAKATVGPTASQIGRVRRRAARFRCNAAGRRPRLVSASRDVP